MAQTAKSSSSVPSKWTRSRSARHPSSTYGSICTSNRPGPLRVRPIWRIEPTAFGSIATVSVIIGTCTSTFQTCRPLADYLHVPRTNLLLLAHRANELARGSDFLASRATKLARACHFLHSVQISLHGVTFTCTTELSCLFLREDSFQTHVPCRPVPVSPCLYTQIKRLCPTRFKNFEVRNANLPIAPIGKTSFRNLKRTSSLHRFSTIARSLKRETRESTIGQNQQIKPSNFERLKIIGKQANLKTAKCKPAHQDCRLFKKSPLLRSVPHPLKNHRPASTSSRRLPIHLASKQKKVFPCSDTIQSFQLA